MTLKLITFDVTGTLLTLTESVGFQYAKVASRHGVNAPPDELSKQFYNVFKALLAEHPNFGEGDIGWQEWWARLVFRTFQDSLPDKNLKRTPTIDNISSELIDIYKTKECWKLAEGTQTLLDKLSNQKLRLGVISNYDPRLVDILKDLNIHKYFDFVLTSYDAKCQKPDVAIFKIVETMNKDLTQNQIMHVGDNPRLDFMGSKAAGWNSLLLAENSAKIKDFPVITEEWVVKNVGEIYPLIKCKNMI